ncbi:MAG: ATP-binding cassette domain-containing protein [Anaerolineales bacterium]|nr:ATP-binding cassette domain-containing protein [Anaerolineales bacterium]
MAGTMSLITAQNLSKSYGAQDVFSGATLAIPHRARIALVGPNGVGKTSLLRIIVGVDEANDGQVHRARNLKIGYLPQEASYSRTRREDLNRTLWETCLLAFPDLQEQERELARLENLMADPEEAASVMERYGRLQAEFDAEGGYTYPNRIRQVLNGLGFSPEDDDRLLAEFSGGERTRAMLARLLLEDPELLVLDEPTNHLDIQAVEWLESWIRNWSGAAIIVSHDRYFLDRTVNTVLELSPDGIETFRGNYSAYLQQRAARRMLQMESFKAQQEFIRKEQDYIQRNIAGQNTRQAQGRRKRLNRLMRDNLIHKPEADRHVRIEFGNVERSGDIVLQASDLEVGYPQAGESLFRVNDLLLMRGECAAIMGPNGSGKTTFLKTLVGEVPTYSGDVRLGASVNVGYFAQAHEGLHPNRSAIEELKTVDEDMRDGEIRNVLALFLIRGDESFKPINSLSGGERGRVALAKLVLQGANVLLLDEPTNHLDVPSQEILQSALARFPGTIILVSHDRYLVRALASQIWVISPEKRELEVHPGGYLEYLETRRQLNEVQREVKRKKRRTSSPGKSSRKVEVSLAAVEAQIEELENELLEVSNDLMSASDDVERVRSLGERYALLEKTLEERLQEWEQLAVDLESERDVHI